MKTCDKQVPFIYWVFWFLERFCLSLMKSLDQNAVIKVLIFSLSFIHLLIFIWLCQVLVAAWGIFCCVVWTSYQLCHVGSKVVAHRPCSMWNLSSPTRDGSCVFCIGKCILNHWTTREVPLVWTSVVNFLFISQEYMPPMNGLREEKLWPYPIYPMTSLWCFHSSVCALTVKHLFFFNKWSLC